MTLCLDTVFLVDLLADEPAATAVVQDRTETVVISALSFYELLFGTGSRRRREEVEVLSRSYAVLPATYEVCLMAAEIQSRLQARGGLIPVLDALIGATAILAEAELITRDGHFLRVPEDLGLLVRTY